MRSTPHAHTNYVDGKNTPSEMVEAAISEGFCSLGFSEHGRQTFDEHYGLSIESERAYIEEIKRLKEQYNGLFSIFLGVEQDALGITDRSLYQYVIGSKHYFQNGADHFAVDSAIEDVLDGCERFFGGDWCALAERYYQELSDYIVGDPPDIIGHFDLLTKHNEGGRLFDERDKRYLDAGYQALERMLKTDALLEVNTGAIARGYRNAPYPALPFLTFWRERSGRAIISSDCHDAKMLGTGYDGAHALLAAAGYRTAWALKTDRELFAEYRIG